MHGRVRARSLPVSPPSSRPDTPTLPNGRLLRLQGRVLLAILLAGAAACAQPKIEMFRADPQQVCQGHPTRLSWKVKGEASLSASPALPGTGAVDPEGAHTFSPDTTTLFTLLVTRGGKSTLARQEVVVLPTGSLIPIVIPTGPAGTGLAATTTAPIEDWDEQLAIDLTTNASDRAVTVIHGGRQVALDPGETSSALRGLPVSGPWTLRADLLPGEHLGDPAHAPPDRLRLELQLDCAGED